jgi:NADH-quinone oxidoreductase subunit J
MGVSFPEILAMLLLVGTALGVVLMRNAVHAAIMLIANFLVLAGSYVALEARFVAMTQIIVYAGAIVVLFLFVIMLLSAANANVGVDLLPAIPVVALLGSLGLAGSLIYAFVRYNQSPLPVSEGAGALGGGLPQVLGPLLYSPDKWLYALLVVGFLLLVATVAAVVLVEPERLIKTDEGQA